MVTREKVNAQQRKYNKRHLVFLYLRQDEKAQIENLARSAGVPISRYLKGLIVDSLQLRGAHE